MIKCASNIYIKYLNLTFFKEFPNRPGERSTSSAETKYLRRVVAASIAENKITLCQLKLLQMTPKQNLNQSVYKTRRLTSVTSKSTS